MELGQIVYAAEAYIVAVVSISFTRVAQPNNEFYRLIINEEPLWTYLLPGPTVVTTLPR